MRSRLARICGYGFGVLTMVIAIEGQLLAGAVPTAPEIDGSLIWPVSGCWPEAS